MYDYVDARSCRTPRISEAGFVAWDCFGPFFLLPIASPRASSGLL